MFNGMSRSDYPGTAAGEAEYSIREGLGRGDLGATASFQLSPAGNDCCEFTLHGPRGDLLGIGRTQVIVRRRGSCWQTQYLWGDNPGAIR